MITRSGRRVTPSKRNEHIQELLTKMTRPKKNVVNQSGNNDDHMSYSEDDDENDENKIEPAHATALFNDETDVAGRDMYGFHTPKKRDAMKKLAENTPKTPLTDLKLLTLNSPKTPKTPKTPKSSNARIASLRLQQNLSTPTEIRAKNKQTLEKRCRKVVQESETESSADEHSDYEPDNEQSTESNEEERSDSESDSEADVQKDNRKVPPIKISTKSGKITSIQAPTRMSTRGQSRAKNHEDFIPDSDNYFMTASNKKVNLHLLKNYLLGKLIFRRFI